MTKQFVFFYLMRDGVPGIREAVPEHVAYWKGARLDGYRGGPFADRSGGLITFRARDLQEATAIVEGDPFVRRGLLGERRTKEWLPE
jgi:uncharacterized protein YciI